MSGLSRLALALILVATAGCYRTHYAQFSDYPERVTESAPSYLPKKAMGWQSFFIYGWAPGERLIDAVEACGAPELVHSIQTRRTFAEGLVAAVAGYYINIYSPWDGAVYCIETPDQVQDATPAAPTPESPSSSDDCESGHSISSLADDGGLVVLEDGSVWQVETVDTVDTGLWEEGEGVLLCGSRMINTRTGDRVSVTPLN